MGIHRVFFALILALPITAPAQSTIENIINDILTDPKVHSDIMDQIKDLGLNCAASPDNWMIAQEELGKILQGLFKVGADQVLQLALKKDYPTLCHVMSKNQIKSGYTQKDDQYIGSKCLNKIFGKCVHSMKMYGKKIEYYWPKYFVESTRKGYDPHPAFAKDNLLYRANRKVSWHLHQMFTGEGSHRITSTVMGANLLRLLDKNYKSSGFNAENFYKSTILSPFEKMRVRANSSPKMDTYDANIWPVGMSFTYGRNLSLCSPYTEKTGGVKWPFEGVPQTCPISMSADVYPYWDTGVLDLSNPATIPKLATGLNPLTCAASKAAEELASQGGLDTDGYGDKTNILNETGNLSKKMKQALNFCSFPVFGAFDEVLTMASSAANPASWKGPFCTFWGPLAPRKSSGRAKNIFSYANAALKYKLLSHELHGVERGDSERWSLASPWEGQGADMTDDEFSKFLEKWTKKLGQDNEILKKLKDMIGMNGVEFQKNRSEGFFIPGDPTFVNASSSKLDLTYKALSYLKSLAYVAFLTAGSVEAANRVKKAYEAATGRTFPSPGDIFKDQEKQTKQAEEDTVQLGDEDIYEDRSACSIFINNGILMGEGSEWMDTAFRDRPPGLIPMANDGKFSFMKNVSKEECLSKFNDYKCEEEDDDDMDDHDDDVSRSDDCPRNGLARLRLAKIWPVKVGTKRVPNPKQYKITEEKCSLDIKQEGSLYFKDVVCQKKLEYTGRKSTAKKTGTIDPNKPGTIVNDKKTAEQIRVAAKSALWLGIEMARRKHQMISGKNHFGGDRRVYTVWEKIKCEPNIIKGDIYVGGNKVGSEYIGPGGKPDCRAAITFTVRKYLQQELLRRICDAFGHTVGKPFLKLNIIE